MRRLHSTSKAVESRSMELPDVRERLVRFESDATCFLSRRQVDEDYAALPENDPFWDRKDPSEVNNGR